MPVLLLSATPGIRSVLRAPIELPETDVLLRYPQWTLAAVVTFFRFLCDPGTIPDTTGFWLLALLDPRLALYVPAVVAHVAGRSLRGPSRLR